MSLESWQGYNFSVVLGILLTTDSPEQTYEMRNLLDFIGERASQEQRTSNQTGGTRGVAFIKRDTQVYRFSCISTISQKEH